MLVYGNKKCSQKVAISSLAIYHNITYSEGISSKKEEILKNEAFLQTRPVSNSRPVNYKSRALTNRLSAHLVEKGISERVFLIKVARIRFEENKFFLGYASKRTIRLGINFA